MGERFAGSGMYRPLGNEVLEWYQNRGRAWYAEGMISKRDIRRAVRYLRAGGVLWYAPDQDFGAAHSAFVPFFGVPTATLLASHRLPRMTGCRVMAMMPRFDRGSGGYVVELSPLLEDYPGEDPLRDLERINALLEAQVRSAPEQYWWIHRRFKTRPPGEPDFYGADARTGDAAPRAGSSTADSHRPTSTQIMDDR
jgi:KDO2-lipid IV(A) lauroyltransferase